jgi:uncharacterized protein DUF1579
MKTKIFVLALLLSACNFLRAQSDKEMQAWMDYMTPGDVHKMLAKADGEWLSEATMWMDPAAPPTKSTATVVNKMILGGRYQYSTFSGNMMGMPFEGISILGYDNAKKIYLNTWIDNMGTGIMMMEGTWDEASKTINFKGKMVDPTTGKDEDVREIFKLVDDKTHTMEMYGTKDGKEMKWMEAKLTKK